MVSAKKLLPFLYHFDKLEDPRIERKKRYPLSDEERYFISSLEPNAKEIAEAIRSHWAIENSLHWVLDVTLGEDNCRIRKDNAPENMAIVRPIVLNLLRGAKGHFRKDMSLKGLQKKAGWGEATLSMILMQQF